MTGKLNFRPARVATIAALVMATGGSADAALEWTGFGSGYLQQNTTGNLVQPQSKAGLNGQQYSLVGLNLRSQIDDEFSFSGQVVATGFGLSGIQPFVMTFDWGFLSYKPNTNFEVRVGRQLFPGSVIAEYQDVGALLPFARTPMAFFRTAPFKSMDGISVDYSVPFLAGKVGASLLGGSAATPVNAETINFIGLKGGTLYYQDSGLLIRASMSHFEVNRTNSSGTTVQYNDDVYFYSIGAKYDRDNIVAIAEYRQRGSDQFGTNGTSPALPYNQLTIGSMGSFGYRFGNFLPVYTYSYGDFRGLGNLNAINDQHTVTLGYSMSPNVVLKAEYSIVGGRDGRGSNGSPSSSAGGILLDDPAGAGLGTSTGQFFLVGADFIF